MLRTGPFSFFKALLAIFSVAVLSIIGCNSRSSSAFVPPPQSPLRVIADRHATTNQLIRALQALQASKKTNEPPEFWSAIANSTNYSVDHRQRAALQLFARHFKPGMTIHQIAALLNHPTWLVRDGCNFNWNGAPPPGGDADDKWAWACIFFNHPQSAAIWFRFKEKVMTARVDDLFHCLQGQPSNAEVDNIKVIGIVSVEDLSSLRAVCNRFGISDNSDVSTDTRISPPALPPGK